VVLIPTVAADGDGDTTDLENFKETT